MKQLLILGLMVVAGTTIYAAEKPAAEKAKIAAVISEGVDEQEAIEDGKLKPFQFKKYDYSRGELMVFAQMKKFDAKRSYWTPISVPWVIDLAEEPRSRQYEPRPEPTAQKSDNKAPDTPRPATEKSSKGQKSQEAPF